MTKQDKTKPSSRSRFGCCKTILLLLSAVIAIIAAFVLQAHYEHPEPRLPIHFTAMSVMIKSIASYCRNFPFSEGICHVIHHGTGEVITEIEHATITHLNVSSASPEIEAGNVPVLVFTPKIKTEAAPGSPQANLVLLFLLRISKLEINATCLSLLLGDRGFGSAPAGLRTDLAEPHHKAVEVVLGDADGSQSSGEACRDGKLGNDVHDVLPKMVAAACSPAAIRGRYIKYYYM